MCTRVHVCVVYTHTHVHTEAEEDVASYYIMLCFILLRQDVSLNLKLIQQPVSPKDLLVSALSSFGVNTVSSHACLTLLHGGCGFKRTPHAYRVTPQAHITSL